MSSGEQAAAGPPTDDEQMKGKGVGKNRPGPKPRASERAATKTKQYAGVLTRRQEKRMQEEEERLRKSMGKLVSTGKKITDPDETDSSNDEIANDNLAVDFSSHDLIRNRIANPEIFDEPVAAGPPNPVIDVISVNAPSSSSATAKAESSSMWSLSLRSFSFYRRNTEAPAETGRVESVAEDAILQPPQHTSTPNQNELNREFSDDES